MHFGRYRKLSRTWTFHRWPGLYSFGAGVGCQQHSRSGWSVVVVAVVVAVVIVVALLLLIICIYITYYYSINCIAFLFANP